MSLVAAPVKVKFTFDYTLQDGPLKGREFPAGQAWDGPIDRDKAAEALAHLMGQYGCRVSISRRTRGQVWL